MSEKLTRSRYGVRRLASRGVAEFQQRLGNQLQGRSNFYFPKINDLELTHPGAPAKAMLVNDSATVKNSSVFIRGQQETKGELVPRRFLEVLSPNRQPLPFKEGSGRLELAQDEGGSMTRPTNENALRASRRGRTAPRETEPDGQGHR